MAIPGDFWISDEWCRTEAGSSFPVRSKNPIPTSVAVSVPVAKASEYSLEMNVA